MDYVQVLSNNFHGKTEEKHSQFYQLLCRVLMLVYHTNKIRDEQGDQTQASTT
jgi:hypothetical protein